ncbi:MAG: sigma-70 family RNA polymerase sigma factor [Ruminococcaceae bacterium]|nr:sigma-70 family RNA polymerase sigma factor [Oscillospiraceae bacterium]
MEDRRIVELYWLRSEEAITASERKYGAYCNTISYNITYSHEDAEECVNETWIRSWNTMPPQKPMRLMAFFGKIVRNCSLDLFRRKTALQRGGGSVPLALEELSECLASEQDVEKQVESRQLSESLNRFLHDLPQRDCNLFLRRYFYMDSVETAAKRYHITAKNAAVILHRVRKKLAEYLQKEGLL